MMNNEKKKEDIKQMTDKHLDFLLNNYSGIGVIIEKKDGSILRYFYQNFESPTDGIERARKQIRPLLDKGIYRKVIYVESSKNYKGE